MKEDFLVIDHNGMLRILFLKCNTLLKLKEYSNKKNLNQILKENTTVNTILDKKGNDIKIEEIEKNKTLESTPVPTPPSPYSVKIIEKNKTLENEIIETNKNIIFSPRKETQMVTIELNENKKDIIVEIEKTEEEINEMEDEMLFLDKLRKGHAEESVNLEDFMKTMKTMYGKAAGSDDELEAAYERFRITRPDLEEASDTDVGGGAKPNDGEEDIKLSSDAALDNEVEKMGYNESKGFDFKKMVKEALTPKNLR